MKRLALVVSVILVLLSLSISSVMAYIGSGVLYVYTDSAYNVLAPTGDPQDAFKVLPSQIVYIQVAGINEFNVGDSVLVKICWDSHVKTYTMTVKTLGSGQTGAIGVGDSADPIVWTVGEFDDGTFDIPYCETITVHYKDVSGTGKEYIAAGLIRGVGHVHVIPEVPFGTIASLFGLFAALGVFTLAKTKKARHPAY